LKVSPIVTLIDKGGVSSSDLYARVRDEISAAAKAVVWPEGSNDFALNNTSVHGNGVVPMKAEFQKYLRGRDWHLESKNIDPNEPQPGAFDAWLESGASVCVGEWETGNVSSSHRSVNKMALGLMDGWLSIGILVVPTKASGKYLTDRIGTIEELDVYFRFWRKLEALVETGYLGIIAIEHDRLDPTVEKIPKGEDGNALAHVILGEP